MLRHGATAGNLEKRFIGVTDDPLCDSGREGIREIIAGWERGNTEGKNPFELLCTLRESKDDIYVSPLCRCRESAQIFFPNAVRVLCDEFRECDFGILENRTHEELMSDDRYVSFIESEKSEAFPEGENIEAFLKRCADGFEKLVMRKLREDNGDNRILVLVVHGGTIMGIMNAFSQDRAKVPYYKWSPENGHGYLADVVCSDEGIAIENAQCV